MLITQYKLSAVEGHYPEIRVPVDDESITLTNISSKNG